LKLLVISHACVTPVNQSFFVDVVQQTGWNVELVIPSSWNSEYKSNLQASRWKDFQGQIHTIPVWKAGNIPLHVYKQTMIGLLRKVRPDVIYVHHEPYGLATAQIYLANRLVDNRPIGFYGAQNILKHYPIPFRWLEHWVLQNSAFCFPVTEGALEVVKQKGYKGIAEVLPLALDKGIYHPEPVWAQAKRVELGIAEDEFVIGYLGRLVEEKGLQAMLHAAQVLQGRRWRCVLVGSGPYEPELSATVAKLGMTDHVFFAGFVPHEEAPGWLSLFDVLVLASETRSNWKEQFGRVILEANACETAVIGTESGEIGNVLRDTGGGLIVPEANIAELGKAMLELAEDPNRTRKLALQGAAAVREKYDQGYLASRFVTTIRNASKREGSKP
jgi:glycosyltransferase involved in cell wall biosynthesis